MLTPSLRLVSLLGHGGMGSVWRAEHLTIGKQVAVKLLADELTDDAEAHERFVREATLLGQLTSPHVVAVHDFGDSAGTPFFVMELLEGEDLGDRLARVQKLPLGTVTAILAQLCKALDRIHEIGVVHRDLKPGNVFLTKVDGDLVVKLVDFGIAKNAQASFKTTSTGALLGTPLYMSPEQVLSTKDVGPASDLYSLAVVVYECLTGQPPFTGETLGAIHVAITQGRYTPASKLVPGLHPAIDAWFARALASDPAARFGSSRDLVDAFLAASRGVAPSASPPPGAGTTARMGSAPGLTPALSRVVATKDGAARPGSRPGSWATRRMSSRRAALAIAAGLLGGLGLAAVVVPTWLGRGERAREGERADIVPASPASPAASLAPTSPSASAALPVEALPVAAPSASASASATPSASAKKPGPRPRKDRGF
jgi:serine/threonine-protein kinase